jgi:hypothetical protein
VARNGTQQTAASRQETAESGQRTVESGQQIAEAAVRREMSRDKGVKTRGKRRRRYLV